MSKVAALSVKEEIGHGTIRPASDFDPEKDATALLKALTQAGDTSGGHTTSNTS